MADARRTRRRIESEKRRARVTRPQLASLRGRAVVLRPVAAILAGASLALAIVVGALMPGLIVGGFGVGLAAFLAFATMLRCPACLTTLEVKEQLAPFLPKKIRCPRCDMQAPSS